MKEFFQNLKAKREEKGITLEEIHRKTYLPLDYLNAIESGNFEKLPSGYDRIYLKRYALEIGLDAQEVLRDYDMLSGRLTAFDSVIKRTVDSENMSAHSENHSKRQSTAKIRFLGSGSKLDQLNLDKLYKYFWIILAVMVISVTGFFTYRQYIHEKDNQITIREIPSSAVINDKISLSSLKLADNSQSTPVAAMKEGENKQMVGEKESFVIELKALDTTWVRQITNGTDTTEYILPTGLRHKIESKEKVTFMVGKADGIEFWLNGENLGIMGNTDEVVLNLVISQKGIIEKRIKKVIKRSTAKLDSTVAVIPIL